MGAAMNLVTEPADRVLVITRVFDAPRELVFKAWTEPEHMARWFGPAGFTSKVLKHDLRPGGSYRIHMLGPDGDHWTQGVYREVVPPGAARNGWELGGCKRQSHTPGDDAHAAVRRCRRQDQADSAQRRVRVGYGARHAQ